ncbi:hypothetical protein ACFQ0D_16155, partial [Micromonospora zhanjiangensis]
VASDRDLVPAASDRDLVPVASDRDLVPAVTKRERRDRPVGRHRQHDPADDVPKPAGFGWLLPPILYRAGWAARVLSVGMVLLLVLVAIGFTVRALRDGGESGGGTAIGTPTPPTEELPPVVPSGSSPAAPGTTKPATAGPARGPVRSTTPGANNGTGASRTTPKSSDPAPAAQPAQAYLTASASAFCRGDGSWAFTISGRLHNASVGYDPTGYADHGNGTSYGYPISGDGSTSFSGSVPPLAYGGEHRLTDLRHRRLAAGRLRRRRSGDRPPDLGLRHDEPTVGLLIAARPRRTCPTRRLPRGRAPGTGSAGTGLSHPPSGPPAAVPPRSGLSRTSSGLVGRCRSG